MTTPRPRLTVRRLMIAVALAGLVMGGLAALNRRRGYALAMAAHHYRSHKRELRNTRFDESGVGHYSPKARYHATLCIKWGASARRPWLPFEADPRDPQ